MIEGLGKCESLTIVIVECEALIVDWEGVEAMPSKVILMMPKNQELSKVSSKDSRIKFQESRIKKNQDQDSRIKRRLNQDKY